MLQVYGSLPGYRSRRSCFSSVVLLHKTCAPSGWRWQDGDQPNRQRCLVYPQRQRGGFAASTMEVRLCRTWHHGQDAKGSPSLHILHGFSGQACTFPSHKEKEGSDFPGSRHWDQPACALSTPMVPSFTPVCLPSSPPSLPHRFCRCLPCGCTARAKASLVEKRLAGEPGGRSAAGGRGKNGRNQRRKEHAVA